MLKHPQLPEGLGTTSQSSTSPSIIKTNVIHWTCRPHVPEARHKIEYSALGRAVE